LGYIAAAIERRGYEIQVIDLASEDYVKIPKADIYGMQVVTPQVKYATKFARKLKSKYPDSIVVAGGPHTMVDKEAFLAYGFDAVVVEEGEFSFFELIRHYELHKEVEQIYWNPPIKLLDDVPFPARHLFKDFKKNALRTHQLLKGDYTEGGQTTMIASRGCPYHCSFCAPHPRKVRFRSPENIITELRRIINEFGIYQFKWQDDTFTINHKWVLELCHLLKTRLPPTYHRVHTRVNVFNEIKAKAMAEAGIKLLCFGIESFSQKVLDLNDKATTIDMIESSLQIAKKYGFKTVGFLIFGMPGEDERSVEETKAGILRNKRYLDYLNLATMTPLLGTPVYKNPDNFNCKIVNHDIENYWIVNHELIDTIMVKTNGVSIDTMKKLKRGMYQFMRDEGYSRPEWRK
jgi:radical SAM superfamily enzyme YgiQ (UPF0313 family)